MLSFIYTQWLDSRESKGIPGKIYSLFFKTMRRLILLIGDPACRIEVRGQPLWMPFSHWLPFYTHGQNQYDLPLGRLAEHLRTTNGRICGIDAGANIGDTILACRPAETDRFLALEPHPLYFTYLERNLGGRMNVRLLRAVCGSNDADAGGYQIKTVRGTAQIQQAITGEAAITATTLDTLLQTQTDFRDCNFLKIDTDGHDFDVIRGARELIGRAKPAVFFECDIFQNPRFVEDIADVFELFARAGYADALIYDNFGYLLHRLNPGHLGTFAFPLLHKLTAQTYYFDVLMLPDGGPFLARELDYFADLPADNVNRMAAKKTVEIIKSNLLARS